MNFGKIFMRQGILLGHFLCDRVQDVDGFAAHPRHFPNQVPPGTAAQGMMLKIGQQSSSAMIFYVNLNKQFKLEAIKSFNSFCPSLLWLRLPPPGVQ